MPATNVLAEAVAAIMDNTVAEGRVHVGARLQSGALPAVVIEQLSSERAALGSGSTISLVRHDLRVSAIAADMATARLTASSAADYAVLNMTFAGYVTFRTSEVVVEEPQSGEGDEQQPSVASLTIQTLFPE